MWLLAYCRGRMEASFVARLKEKKIRTYYPKFVKTIRPRGKVKLVKQFTPAYANYIFVNCREEQIDTVKKVKGFLRFVSEGKELLVVRAKVITGLRLLEKQGYFDKDKEARGELITLMKTRFKVKS
jgi:hypothetical protein